MSALPDLTLVEEIRAEHQLAVANARQTLIHAIRSGELIEKAHSLVPRGKWIAWLNESLPEIATATAYQYMRIYRNRDAIERDGITSVKKAKDYFSGFDRRHLDTADDRRKALEMHREGVCLREIAESLAVNIQTIKTWLDPSFAAERREKMRISAARSRAAEKALRREARLSSARARRDQGGRAYIAVRQALDEAQGALEQSTGDERAAISRAMDDLYKAEDNLAKALRLAA